MPAWAPTAVFEPLLASVKRRHGILHQLFHPFHTIKPEVADALRTCVRRAREAGLEWWTARQINTWERARRTVRLDRCARTATGTLRLTLRSAQPLPDATLLRLNHPRSGGEPSAAAAAADFVAWGFSFSATVQSIEADRPVEIQCDGTLPSA
jgi:hypothetical protein